MYACYKIIDILSERPRIEKIAVKDVKLRTFITEDNSRDDLVEHVYDVTYGVIKPTDSLVIIDDSIVVISAISGGPSEKLGIESGDRIVMIEKKNVAKVRKFKNTVFYYIFHIKTPDQPPWRPVCYNQYS